METPVPIPNTEVKRYTPTILTWRRVGKIGTAKVLFKDLEIRSRGLFLFWGCFFFFSFFIRKTLVVFVAVDAFCGLVCKIGVV